MQKRATRKARTPRKPKEPKEPYQGHPQEVLSKEEYIARANAEATPVGERCPKCNGPLIRRRGSRGEFLGCKAFPQCKGSLSIPEPDKGRNHRDDLNDFEDELRPF